MKRLMAKGNKMNIVYSNHQFPDKINKSIFLAGPTPRDNTTISWRKEAIEILQSLNYDGDVFIPEPSDGKTYPNYDNQFKWEDEALNKADCILFWIPRNINTKTYGLTTNIEWGKWQQSGKVVIGFPQDSDNNRYIQKEVGELGLDLHNTLLDTIKGAMEIVSDGSDRVGAETYVPLYVWKTKEFQQWYQSQKNVGNELRWAKVNYLFKMPKAKKVFFWVLHAHVYIKAEDRVKEIEFAISRSNMCSAVLYKKDNINIYNSEVVLIKEFRTPVNNSECMVYEIPGGSSISEKENIDVIHDEILEETGLNIDKNKLIFIEERQCMSTLSIHRNYLYCLELTQSEMDEIKSKKGQTFGVEEDTELTYIEVFKLKDILNSNLLDWNNIGMILRVINN